MIDSIRQSSLVFVFAIVACASSQTKDTTEGQSGSSGGSVQEVNGVGDAQVEPGRGGNAGQAIVDGTTGAGGSGGSTSSGGGAGVGGAADAGGKVDGGATCIRGTTLPAGAPVLTPGVWINISPAGVPFDANATAFGQGITLDPCSSGTLYLSVQANDPVAGKPGIYKTTNGGSSWRKVGPLDGPLHVKVDPRNPQHLYAADDVRGDFIGFWVSTDGGDAWTQPDGFKNAAQTVTNNHAYYIETDPTDFDHVLLSFHGFWGTNGQTGFLETSDGGSSWTIHQPAPGWTGGEGRALFFLYDPALGIGDSRTWLCANQENGHWRTTDGGGSWTQVTKVNTDHGGNQLYYTKKGVLYAGGNPNLIRSIDNGVTWSPLVFGGYLSVIGDGQSLYTGTHGGGTFVTAKESDDTNWTNYDSQTFAEGPFEMAFDSVNGIVYSSNIRGGLWALKVK